MSPDFCERVVAKSWGVKQRPVWTVRGVMDKWNAMFPVRANWAVMTMAAVFAVGLFIGFEKTNTYTFSDTMDISEIMEI